VAAAKKAAKLKKISENENIKQSAASGGNESNENSKIANWRSYSWRKLPSLQLATATGGESSR